MSSAPIITECLLKNKRVKYDACSAEPVQQAKTYYNRLGYKYIGSSHVYYVGISRFEEKKPVHFFIKTKP